MMDIPDDPRDQRLHYEPLVLDPVSEAALARGDLANVRKGRNGMFGCVLNRSAGPPLVTLDDEHGLPGYLTGRGLVRLEGLYVRRDETGLLTVSGMCPCSVAAPPVSGC